MWVRRFVSGLLESGMADLVILIQNSSPRVHTRRICDAIPPRSPNSPVPARFATSSLGTRARSHAF